jgi:uncharacterized protein YjiS (DUF1127 family)
MLHAITRTIRDWMWVEYEIQRLRWLDERLLADMGIKRDDIAALVRGRRR